MSTQEIIRKAANSKNAMNLITSDQKNRALEAMAKSLEESIETILAANALDLQEAEKSVLEGKTTRVMLDRLALSPDRIRAMAEGIRQVAALPDPVYEILEQQERPNGLRMRKVSVPMGVIAIIYESRPNVTSDAAALALKAGSACILRCGKEAHRSAEAIVDAMRKGMKETGITEEALQLVEDTSRESAKELMHARGMVDLLIPRGGAGLIRACVDEATVPVIETGTGICHVFVEKTADQTMALDIIENAKCSRPSVCNAMEVCLVDRSIAEEFLPKLRSKLVEERSSKGFTPVELRLDQEAAAIIEGKPAGPDDFDTEFLNYCMAIKVVSGTDEAIDHIRKHSTHHSESIVTSTPSEVEKFTLCIDSAAVYVNASTRFTDGGEFGLGCEMGISTQKLHARGPMGLKELCSYKYIVEGSGQIR